MSHALLRLLVFSLLLAAASPAEKPVSLRGLVSLGGDVVWASGTGANIIRSRDDGKSWETCARPGDDTALDFRGISAWSAEHAIAMSAGPGPLSRLYETSDGCKSWHLLFANPDMEGFWDSLTFSTTNPKQGVLLGDPVQKRFTIFRTNDGGRRWIRDSSPALASNPAGEGAFAASNSSIAILPGTLDLIFGTGGKGGARIFRFDAQRNRWSSAVLPVAVNNESSGIFSVSFRSPTRGIAVGGDYKQPQIRTGTAFLTRDGGRTWTAPSALPGGYRSAVAWDKVNKRWISAGPTGLDSSSDDGETWSPWHHSNAPDGNWNVLSLPWAAGSKGLPTRLYSPNE